MLSDRHTLSIGLARTEGDGEPSLEYTFRWSLRAGIEDPLPIRLAASEEGLPANPVSIPQLEDWRPGRLPPSFIEDLRRPLLDDRPDIVWLDFERPRAHLALIPWERLLQPIFHCAVARAHPLSDAIGKLTRADNPYPPNLAICASMPVAKAEFDLATLVCRLTSSFAKAVPEDGMVHVFVDSGHRDTVLYELESAEIRGPQIKIHDAGQTGISTDRSSTIEDTGGKIVNPWMTWMVGALEGRRIDAVAFCCHGYHRYHKGALAFARSPRVNDDHAWSRFVGAEQLAVLLERLGSRLLLLESPAHNFSAPGLFAVAEGVGQLRPGPVAIHDASMDSDFRAARGLFAQALGDLVDDIPASPALSLSTSPFPSRRRRFRSARERLLGASYGSPSRPRGTDHKPASDVDLGSHEALGEVVGPEDVVLESTGGPAKAIRALDDGSGWMAASKRRIESTWSLQAGVSSSSDTHEAARAGVEEALELVAQLMEKHRGGVP